jgi:hypothetical protein
MSTHDYDLLDLDAHVPDICASAPTSGAALTPARDHSRSRQDPPPDKGVLYG